MLDSLTQRLIEIASVPWFILLALIVQLASFRLLRVTGVRFQAVTQNHETFDFQNRLTSKDIYRQLVDYTPASKSLYTRFFLIDLVFPLVASLFLSLLWTAIFLRPDVPVFAALLRANVPVLALLPALFDWGENVCFLLIIHRYPAVIPGMAPLGIIFKRLKLITLFSVIGATMLLLLIAVGLIVKSLLGI